MKKLNKRPGGSKHVPKVYDVLVHEYIDMSKDEPMIRSTVFLVMEHFQMDLKQFIFNKIRDTNETQVI